MLYEVITLTLPRGGEGPRPVASLLVVDEDASFVSGLLLRALDGAAGVV